MLYAQLAALALATTALAAAGCGSTSKQPSTDGSVGASTSTTATTTTATAATKTTSSKPITSAKSILVAKASAICEHVKAQHKSMRLPTKEAFAREIPRFASAQQAAFAELSRLTPPASMAHEWKQLAASARLLASDTTKLGESVAAYHFSALGQMVTRMDKDEHAITTLAKHDAITGCELIYF